MRIVNRRQPFFGRQENTHTFLKEEDGLTSSPVKKNNQLILFPGYEGDLQTYLTDAATFNKWCWVAQNYDVPRVQLLTTEGIGDNGKVVNYTILSGPPSLMLHHDGGFGTNTDTYAAVATGATGYADWDTTTTTQNLSGVVIPNVVKTGLGAHSAAAKIRTTTTFAGAASGSGQFVIRATYGDYTEDQTYMMCNACDDRYSICSKIFVGRADPKCFVNNAAARCVTNAATGILKVCTDTHVDSYAPRVAFTATVSGGVEGQLGFIVGFASGGTILQSYSGVTSGWGGAAGVESPSSDQANWDSNVSHTRYPTCFVVNDLDDGAYNTNSPNNYRYNVFSRTSGAFDFLLRNTTGATRNVNIILTATNVYGMTISSTGYFTVLNG